MSNSEGPAGEASPKADSAEGHPVDQTEQTVQIEDELERHVRSHPGDTLGIDNTDTALSPENEDAPVE